MQKKMKTVGETTSELTNNSVKFEVGATYEFYGSPVIKVKSRTEKTAEVYNFLERKHERRRIFVREDGVEYINLPNTGVYTISAKRKKAEEEKTFKERLKERWAEEESYLNSLPAEEAIAYCKAKLKEFEQYEKEYFNK